MRSSAKEKGHLERDQGGGALKWKGSGSATRRDTSIGNAWKNKDLYSGKSTSEKSTPRTTSSNVNSGKTVGGMNKDEYIHEYVNMGLSWEQAAKMWDIFLTMFQLF